MVKSALNDIKQVISQSGLCSEATIRGLQNLLGGDELGGNAPDAERRTGKSAALSADRRQKTTLSAGVTKDARSRQHPAANLTSNEKRALGTQIVNAVLQALSKAATVKRESFSTLNTCNPQLENETANLENARTSSFVETQSAKTHSELHILERLGLIGFRILDSQTPLTAANQKSSNLKLENGLLTFVSRLITAGSRGRASIALHIFHKRCSDILQSSIKISCTPSSQLTQIQRHPHALTSTSPAYLLTLPNIPIDSEELARLVLEYQLLILRMCSTTSTAEPESHDFDSLDPSRAAAPCKLLACSHKSSQGRRTLEKAFYQVIQLLEIIALDVLKDKSELSKDRALRLSRVAIRNRLDVGLTDTCCNLEAIWTTVGRVFTEVNADSGSPHTKNFETARGLVDDICGHLYHKQDAYSMVPMTICLQLSHFAQAAKDNDEATNWAQRYHNAVVNCSTSTMRSCMAEVRLAHLLNSRDSSKTTEFILAITQLLVGKLEGSTSDRNLLISELISLRKSMISRLRVPDTTQALNALTQSALQDYLDNLCSVGRFYTRFFTMELQHDAKVSCPTHDLDLVKNELMPLIDTILFVARRLMGTCGMAWQMFCSAVQLCVELSRYAVRIPQQTYQSEATEQQPHEKTCLRVSDLCWTFYSASKEDTNDETRLNYLRHSCTTLEGLRPEIMSMGSLSFKLHRLGRHLRRTGATRHALKTLERCLKVCVLSRRFEGIGGELATIAFGRLDALREDKVFFSALKAWLDIQLESKCSFTCWSLHCVGVTDEGLRGALFEWQLAYIASQAYSSSQLENTKRAVTEECLKIYSQKDELLRRMLLISFYLRQSVIAHDDEDHQALVKVAVDMLDPSDGASKIYSNSRQVSQHLCACLSLLVGVHSTSGYHQRIEFSLSTWQKLLDCGDLEALLKCDVIELGPWLQDLHLLAEYCAMRADYAQELLVHTLQVKAASATFTSISVSFLQSDDYPSLVRNEYHIAQALACVAVGDEAQCVTNLKEIDTVNKEKMSERNFQLSHFSKLHAATSTVVSQVEFLGIQSQVALRKGNPVQASVLAKKSLRKAQKHWIRLRSESQRSLQVTATSDDIDDELAPDLAQLHLDSASTSASPDAKGLVGVRFWPLASTLFFAAVRMSHIGRHCGARKDGAAAEHEAAKVAQMIDSRCLIDYSKALQTNSATEAEELQEGVQASSRLMHVPAVPKPSQILVQSLLLHGNAHYKQERWQDAISAYDSARDTLRAANSSNVISKLLSRVSEGVGQSLGYSLQTFSKSTQSSETRAGSKDKSKKVRPHATYDRSTASGPLIWRGLMAQANVGRSFCLLALGQTEDAVQSLRESFSHFEGLSLDLEVELAIAALVLNSGAEQLSKDTVLSMLSESTIASPAITGADEQECLRSRDLDVESPENARLQWLKLLDLVLPKRSGPAEMYLQVTKMAATAHYHLDHWLSNRGRSRLCSLLVKGVTALSLPKLAKESTLKPAQLLSFFLDDNRNKTVLLEREFMKEDARRSTKRNSDAITPNNAILAPPLVSTASFQLGEKIPPTWTILSMSISEDSKQMFLTRYRACETPFTLSIPLGRQHTDDTNPDLEQTLSFETARKTLRDIIAASDETMRSAKGFANDVSVVKYKRTAWWEKREELDRKLGHLLENIERMWLGGFRGILCGQKLHDAGLARFRKSFEAILTKQLPSRQRQKGGMSLLTLDTRIYELFLDLGNLESDHDEVENMLTDLLYFVVDNLQFHGESNAYDEIDFDSMIVETLDALRAYHLTVNTERSPEEKNHLILILDKKLHAIPWETMPCLLGTSVSRLPSIVDVQDRIFCMQEQQTLGLSRAASGISASSDRGTYVLNPGDDIPRTECAFKEPLSSLKSAKGWTNITGRAPSEAELQRALSQNAQDVEPSILLYFGHGSGMQYIRARSVRALRYREGENPTATPPLSSNTTSLPKTRPLTNRPTCTVTLLFGCSSARTVYCGDFNAYGTPLTYINAGAPAVLGALWDITDGDLDVFSRSVLTQWGLLDSSAFQQDELNGQHRSKTRRRGARTGKKRSKSDEEIEKGNGSSTPSFTSLSEACAVGRSNCYLKYLNGAAMVVYGVPVYLSQG
ncbi:MAG: hypothetical protein Q9162_006681 [Coniocarpon cinnabarinum]